MKHKGSYSVRGTKNSQSVLLNALPSMKPGGASGSGSEVCGHKAIKGKMVSLLLRDYQDFPSLITKVI